MIISNKGTSNLTSNVTDILAQLPPVIKSLTGVGLKDLAGKIAGVEAAGETKLEEKEEKENA